MNGDFQYPYISNAIGGIVMAKIRTPDMDKVDGKNWATYHKDKIKSNYPKWPSEMMVVTLFGNILRTPLIFRKSMKVLDIGCGFGNHLRPFLDADCDCYGVEVSNEIVECIDGAFEENGNRAAIKCGTNRELPYDNQFFDLMLSINVLHYETTEEDLRTALKEYARVLKNDGMLYLSTTGPEHTAYSKAEIVGPHLYEFGLDDFRKGQQFFYFDTERYLNHYLSEQFSNIENARQTFNWSEFTADYFIAVAHKKHG